MLYSKVYMHLRSLQSSIHGRRFSGGRAQSAFHVENLEDLRRGFQKRSAYLAGQHIVKEVLDVLYWDISGIKCQKYTLVACNIQNILWKHAH